MPNPKKRGVTLASFAAVRAGLAEGLPLPGLLEAEKIAAASWRRAEGAFDEALADSAAGDGVLLRAFDAHLIAAQDRLARPLPPLDAELGAWLGFVRRISQSEEPTKLLADLGLRSTDVLRLHRAWMAKLDADRALADQARQLLAEEPGELPALSPYSSDGVRPIPPRAEVAAGAEVAEEPRAAAGREEDEDADAADEETDADEEKAAAGPPLFAPLAFEGIVPDPPKRPKPPRPPPPPKDKARPPSAESAVPVVTPAPGRPAEPEAPPAAPGAEAPAVPPRPAALPSFMRQTASASPAAPSAPVAPPVSAPVAPPVSPPVPAAQPGPQRLDTTSEFILPNLAAILPFASKKPEKDGERAKPVEVCDVNASAPPAPAATTAGLPSDLVQRIAAGKLPFARSASPPVAPAAPRPQDEPSTLDARPSPLAGTVLPFAKDKREAPGAGAPGAPAGAKSPLPFQAPSKAPPAVRPPSDHGAEHATLEAAPSPIKAPLPFLRSASSQTPGAPGSPPAAPPSAAPRASAPVAPQPPVQPPAASSPSPSAALTLDQYASMCAELAVFADRADAVFAKYGLTDVRRRAAVDAAWKERLSRYPSERAEWERRYWQYESSWRRSRR